MERTILLNALEKVKAGLASKEIVESMTYFMFSGKDVITYNDKISIQHPLKTNFSLFVKANDLYRIISKLTTEEVSLTEKDGKLNIKSKNLKASLSTITDNEVLERVNNVKKSLKKAEWKKLPEDFSNNINLCSFVASKQESDQSLTCVQISEKECRASDNKRIARSYFSEPIDDMLLKASEIKNLIGINPIEYSITKAWIHFKNIDNCIFSMRKIDGNFPDFSQFFEFDGIKVDLPKNLLQGTDIVSTIADSKDPSVNIKISNEACIITGQSEAGKIQHRSKIKYKGKDIDFNISPDFLKEMMSHSSSIIISKDRAKLQTDNGFSLVTAFFV